MWTLTWRAAHRLPSRDGNWRRPSPLAYSGDNERCVVTSYWTVFRWQFKAEKREVASIGYSKDTMVKRQGKWLISERALYWLTDEHGPWFGPKAQ